MRSPLADCRSNTCALRGDAQEEVLCRFWPVRCVSSFYSLPDVSFMQPCAGSWECHLLSALRALYRPGQERKSSMVGHTWWVVLTIMMTGIVTNITHTLYVVLVGIFWPGQSEFACQMLPGVG